MLFCCLGAAVLEMSFNELSEKRSFIGCTTSDVSFVAIAGLSSTGDATGECTSVGQAASRCRYGYCCGAD